MKTHRCVALIAIFVICVCVLLIRRTTSISEGGGLTGTASPIDLNGLLNAGVKDSRIFIPLVSPAIRHSKEWKVVSEKSIGIFERAPLFYKLRHEIKPIPLDGRDGRRQRITLPDGKAICDAVW